MIEIGELRSKSRWQSKRISFVDKLTLEEDIVPVLNEAMRTILISIGKEVNGNEKLPYDSVGISPGGDVLAIGFQQNKSASILIMIAKDENSLDFSFNEQVGAFEALTFFMEVIEKVPCKCNIIPNFRIQ